MSETPEGLRDQIPDAEFRHHTDTCAWDGNEPIYGCTVSTHENETRPPVMETGGCRTGVPSEPPLRAHHRTPVVTPANPLPAPFCTDYREQSR